MALLYILFVLAFAVPVGAGLLLHRRGVSVAGGPRAWGEAAADRFGRIGGPVVVLVVGYVVTAAVSLGLGFFAKAIESSVYHPIFTWVQDRTYGHGALNASEFTTANAKLTNIGLNTNVQLVVLFSGLILIAAYRRNAWLPVASLAVAVLGEKYLQKILGKIVDRGHPPTTAGTFPSGGVGRILAVYGTVLILVLVLQPRLSRAWKAGLWTGIATAAVVEAYTRVYLSLHWFTDALFGLAFGAMLMVTHVAAVSAAAAGVGLRSEPDAGDAATSSVAGGDAVPAAV